MSDKEDVLIGIYETSSYVRLSVREGPGDMYWRLRLKTVAHSLDDFCPLYVYSWDN